MQQPQASDKVDLYQVHLNRVSRSFAFCIEQLEMPLREWVGLSYILCRLVDTIEDSPWSSTEDQLLAFSEFKSFIRERPSPESLATWRNRMTTSIPEGEKLLLDEAHSFFMDLHRLPEPIRLELQQTLLNMTRGMIHFSSRTQGQGQMRLHSLSETNQYCFFVAGIIGELLTNLMSHVVQGIEIPRRMLTDSCHFGLYLQKINLLKDQRTDEKEGRFLVPSREQTYESLKLNAARALEYLKGIPLEMKGYRLFCAWSLFLGLASLPWIERAWSEQKRLKISREETWTILQQVHDVILDNESLEALFDQFLPGEASESTAFGETSDSWLHEVYQGRLNSRDFHELGMGRFSF